MDKLCRHFNECGGCDAQDKDYNEQLAAKEGRLKEVLTGLEVEDIGKIVPSPEVWYYRNKMEYIVGKDQGSPVIGLRRKKKFYRIVDLQECRIFNKDVHDIFGTVKDWIKEESIETYDLFKHTGRLRYVGLRHSKYYDEMMAIIVVAMTADEFEADKEKYSNLTARLKKIKNIRSVYLCLNSGVADVSMTEEIRLLDGVECIKEKVNGIDYLVGPTVFFQTNSSCCSRLYDIIKDEAKGMSGDVLFDLFCGSGGIALQMAGRFAKVVGIDLSEKNIKNARRNAELNKIVNTEFISEDAESFLSKWVGSKSGEGAPAMIVDPPRSGLSKKTRSIILESGAHDIIYVSCNPANMKEDLKVLSEKYTVKKIVPVDMFPHTRHLEAVAILKNSNLKD